MRKIQIPTLMVVAMFCISPFALNAQMKKAKGGQNIIMGDAETYLYTWAAYINYERYLFSIQRGKIQFYGRVGLGSMGIAFDDEGSGIRIMGGILTGRKKRHLEIGLGYQSGLGYSTFKLPAAAVGYRYQKPEGGIMYRVYAGVLGVGVGLGYAFR